VNTFTIHSGSTAIWLSDDVAPLPRVASQLETLGFTVGAVVDGLDVIECRLARNGLTYSLSWDVWGGLVFFPYELEGEVLILVVLEHLRSVGW
jgi:hypothetical protein